VTVCSSRDTRGVLDRPSLPAMTADGDP
jgi:hypothetical protein